MGMTDASADHLVGESRLRAALDKAFVGSAEHLELLRAFARDRIGAANVEWAREACYSEETEEGPFIAIRHPSQYGVESSEARVTLAAQYLVHEIHHVLYSDYAALQDFQLRVLNTAKAGGLGRIDAVWVNDLCNRLEDARLLKQARQLDPDDAPHLEAVHRTGLELSLRNYEDSHGESPWGPSPADPAGQLTLALSALILLDEHHHLTDRNKAAFEGIREHVAAARSGTSTSAVIDAATEIEAIVVAEYS